MGLDLQEPILRCGNPSQIFPDMLLSHEADGNLRSVAIYDGDAKEFLRQENAFSMVAKGPVAEVAEDDFDSSNQL